MTDELMRPLHSSWQLYQQARLPVGLPADELAELRCAYFGGASAMWTLLQHIAEMPLEPRTAAVNSLQAEVALHLASVGRTYEGKL